MNREFYKPGRGGGNGPTAQAKGEALRTWPTTQREPIHVDTGASLCQAMPRGQRRVLRTM